MRSNQSGIVCLVWLVIAAIVGREANATEQKKNVIVDAAFANKERIVLIADGEALFIDPSNNAETEVKPASEVKVGPDMHVQSAWDSRGKGGKVLYKTEKSVYYASLGSTQDAQKYKFDLEDGGPDAAAKKGLYNRVVVYQFKGCDMYERYSMHGFGKPQDVTRIGLPCNPDAAWADGDDMIVMVKSAIWRWRKDGKVIGPCPFSSTYSITSWQIELFDYKAADSSCGEGWKLHCPSKKCYKAVTSSSMNWTSARHSCQTEHKGDLATVRDQAELDFLNDMIEDASQDFWIGLHTDDGERKFRWLDENEEVTLTNWYKRQPSNNGGREDCVNIIAYAGYYNGWNDAPCGSNYKYICQRELGP